MLYKPRDLPSAAVRLLQIAECEYAGTWEPNEAVPRLESGPAQTLDIANILQHSVLQTSQCSLEKQYKVSIRCKALIGALAFSLRPMLQAT